MSQTHSTLTQILVPLLLSCTYYIGAKDQRDQHGDTNPREVETVRCRIKNT